MTSTSLKRANPVTGPTALGADRTGHPCLRAAVVALAVAGVLLGAARWAGAATHTWTGATSAAWSVAGNWTGGAPAPAEAQPVDLVFPEGGSNPAMNNDIAGLILNSISFTATTTAYSIGGANGFTLGAGGISTVVAVGIHHQINVALTLGASCPFVVSTQLLVNSTLAVGAYTLTVTTNSPTSAFVQDVVSGNGAIVKNGNDSLILSGLPANTFSGSWTINAGSVRANKPAGVAAINGPVTINSGGYLYANNTSNNNFGTSEITVNAGGTLDLQVFGSTAQSIGSLTGAGGVKLGVATLTIGTDNTSTTFSGAISGTGGIVKTGSGTLTLTGTSTYTGSTAVNAGYLTVNGSIATSAVTISGFGGLAGVGTVGPLTMTGGAMEPGGWTGLPPAIPGILAASGASTLAAPGLYVAIINGPTLGTDYSQLQVTGTLALGDAVLQFQSVPYTPTPGTVYTIITTSGGVSGTFGGLAEGASVLGPDGTSYRVSYAANSGRDVTLTDLTRTTGIPALDWLGLVILALALGAAAFLVLRRMTM
ncbi:MAG: autotransporter-associated beta strand repeat-containing protein [Acidobacteriia bacterium]|nr:autotransporter-associated beta strand repeat-containing protein [Terriglobia bacterium]